MAVGGNYWSWRVIEEKDWGGIDEGEKVVENKKGGSAIKIMWKIDVKTIDG